MTPTELQGYLHDHNPMSAAMQVSVLEFHSRLVIQRNSMSYELPIAVTFTARSFISGPGTWVLGAERG